MSQRVLHVIPGIASRYGGPSQAVIGICRALTASGVDTLIVTTDGDGQGRLAIVPGASVVHEGVRAMFFRRYGDDSFKWSPGLSRWLAGHVSTFDVVHIHAVFSDSTLAAGRACLAARVPFILRPLGAIDPANMLRHRLRKRVLLAAGLGRVLRHASAVHYTCRQEQRRAERTLPWLPRGVVIPLGADDAYFDDKTDSTAADPYVLALSRLDGNKGIDLLIQAMHRIAVRGRLGAWRLVVAGDGEPGYVERLRMQAADGGARERIRFAGWVDGDARLALVRGASLFALPSRHESFGLGLIEALAAGVPALVTPGVNLAADIVEANAGWMAERHNDALVSTIEKVMNDAPDRIGRSRSARLYAERFRWGAVGAALSALYTDVGGAAHVRREPAVAPAAG